jgi:hypothetical protein
MDSTDRVLRIETRAVNTKPGAEDEDGESGEIGIDEEDEMLITG